MYRAAKSLLLLLLMVLASAGELRADPLPGSQLPLEQNMCAQCHGDGNLWQGDQLRVYVPTADLANDVHWSAGVVCHDCHGGDPASQEFSVTHKADGFRATADKIRQACARCHEETVIEVTRKSVHAKAGPANARGEGTALDCAACHGEVKHQLLSAENPASPIFIDKRYETCGSCHEKELQEYLASVHGPEHARTESMRTALCTDCHGVHGIYRQADKRSTLFPAHVDQTCGKCHAGVNEVLQQSVHGATAGDADAEQLLFGAKETRKPVCTSCHQRHEAVPPQQPALISELNYQTGCGNCHAKLGEEKSMLHHAELTPAGFVAAAECAECHGAHGIPPLDDPASPLAADNRVETCQQCHENATSKFAAFNPHANYKDHEKYPGLHRAHAWIEIVVFLGLGFFMLHSVLWILRSLVDVLRFGPHQRTVSGSHGIVRFSRQRRIVRGTIVVAILGLITTGMIVHFSAQTRARWIAARVGGFVVIANLHKFFGVLLMVVSAFFLLAVVRVMWRLRNRLWRDTLLGPDSPVPNKQDFRDIREMLKWFVWLGEKPKFDRWTFWEKFDFWALVFLIVFVGGSGLILWIPNPLARLLPEGALNAAQMIHHSLSLTVTSIVMVIRYVNTHFRPEKFPLDLSSVTGVVSEEHLERARPKLLARLRAQGQLERMRTTLPSRKKLVLIILGVGMVQAAGLVVILATLVASLEQ